MSTLSPIPFVSRDGVIYGLDYAGRQFTLNYEDGDMSGDGWSANLAERIDGFNRGEAYAHRPGNDTFPTFKFTAHMTQLTCSVGGTIFDFITRNTGGAWADAVSTLGPFRDWITQDIGWRLGGAVLGADGDSIAFFKKCDMQIGIAEAPGALNKFSISGTVLRPRESTFTLVAA